MVGRAAAFLVVVTVGRAIALDCNQNDVPDREDMESGTSADCNGNLVPDECDLRWENRWLRATPWIRILMDFFIPQDTNIPAPGPFECGPDPSLDDIGCDSPPEC